MSYIIVGHNFNISRICIIQHKNQTALNFYMANLDFGDKLWFPMSLHARSRLLSKSGKKKQQLPVYITGKMSIQASIT